MDFNAEDDLPLSESTIHDFQKIDKDTKISINLLKENKNKWRIIYGNVWIAIHQGEVIASSSCREILLEDENVKNMKHIIITNLAN